MDFNDFNEWATNSIGLSKNTTRNYRCRVKTILSELEDFGEATILQWFADSFLLSDSEAKNARKFNAHKTAWTCFSAWAKAERGLVLFVPPSRRMILKPPEIVLGVFSEALYWLKKKPRAGKGQQGIGMSYTSLQSLSWEDLGLELTTNFYEVRDPMESGLYHRISKELIGVLKERATKGGKLSCLPSDLLIPAVPGRPEKMTIKAFEQSYKLYRQYRDRK